MEEIADGLNEGKKGTYEGRTGGKTEHKRKCKTNDKMTRTPKFKTSIQLVTKITPSRPRFYLSRIFLKRHYFSVFWHTLEDT